MILSETERSDRTAQLLSNNEGEEDSLESNKLMRAKALMPNNPMLMGSMSSQDVKNGGTQNNYDFLVDEESANVINRERLINFAEKLTVAFALKENLTEMNLLESFLLEACRS